MLWSFSKDFWFATSESFKSFNVLSTLVSSSWSACLNKFMNSLVLGFSESQHCVSKRLIENSSGFEVLEPIVFLSRKGQLRVLECLASCSKVLVSAGLQERLSFFPGLKKQVIGTLDGCDGCCVLAHASCEVLFALGNSLLQQVPILFNWSELLELLSLGHFLLRGNEVLLTEFSCVLEVAYVNFVRGNFIFVLYDFVVVVVEVRDVLLVVFLVEEVFFVFSGFNGGFEFVYGLPE